MTALEEIHSRILALIEGGKSTRDEIADVYAEMIEASAKEKNPEGIPEVNAAIRKRWSLNALYWIKSEAWKRVRW